MIAENLLNKMKKPAWFSSGLLLRVWSVK